MLRLRAAALLGAAFPPLHRLEVNDRGPARWNIYRSHFHDADFLRCIASVKNAANFARFAGRAAVQTAHVLLVGTILRPSLPLVQARACMVHRQDSFRHDQDSWQQQQQQQLKIYVRLTFLCVCLLFTSDSDHNTVAFILAAAPPNAYATQSNTSSVS
jgi:hypothetical protein